MKRAKTDTIISALRVLAADLKSVDRSASEALYETAERMAELQDLLKKASGPMSHGQWSSNFRRKVERVIDKPRARCKRAS